MPVIPGQAPLEQVLHVLRFADAVPFARVAEHHRFDADVLQPDIELFRLLDRHVVVVLAVRKQRRRPDVLHVPDGTALPQPVGNLRLLRVRAELHRQVVVIVGQIVLRDQVRDAGGRDRRLEAIGLRDDPVRKLSAVTHALETHPIPIEPRIARQRGVDAGEHVFRFAAVLVVEDRIGELLAVAGRAAEVHHQRRKAVAGVDLRARIERRPLLSVWTPVHDDDQRYTSSRRLRAGRLREKRLDLHPIEALERESLHIRDRARPEQVLIQRGECAARGRTRFEEELRRPRGRGKRVRDDVLRRRPGGQRPVAAHLDGRRAAVEPQSIEMGAAALLHTAQDGSTIWCPAGIALPVVDRGAYLAAMAAVRIHHPDVRILHRCLRGGELALRPEKRNCASVRRPHGIVFSALRRREPLNRSIVNREREHVVVEHPIGIGFAVRDEQQAITLRRPVERMLVRISVRELAHVTGGDIRDEDVQSAVVVEAREPLGRGRLVEIPRDHHRVAGRVLLGPWRARYERDRFAVRRPGELVARGRQRVIRPRHLCDESRIGAVGARDDETKPIAARPEIRDRSAVGRPPRRRRRSGRLAQAHGAPGGDLHEPHLRIGPARPIAVDDAVSDARRIGREVHVSNRFQDRNVGDLERGPLRRVDWRMAGRHDERQRHCGGGRGSERDVHGASGPQRPEG